MTIEKLLPVARDIVFLLVGPAILGWEVLHDARPVPMGVGLLMSLGPTVVSAYWSERIRANGSPASPVPSSPPPPLPSPSSPAGEP